MKLSEKETEIIQLIRDECGVPWHDVQESIRLLEKSLERIKRQFEERDEA